MAATALPNTDSPTLDRIFTAEVAKILRVLRDFLLLNNLTEGGPVTGSVLSGDTCAFESRKEKTNLVSSNRERARKADERKLFQAAKRSMREGIIDENEA